MIYILKQTYIYKKKAACHKETCNNMGTIAPFLEQKRPTYTKREMNVEKETYIYKNRYTKRPATIWA